MNKLFLIPVLANPVVRKTAVAAMFMTSVAGMGAAKAENRTPKADYTTTTTEILPAAYPLVQAQTTKPMVRVRNTALENKALSFAKTEAEKAELREYMSSMYNTYGTYVTTIELQRSNDEDVIRKFVNNEYNTTKAKYFLDWYDDEYIPYYNYLVEPLLKKSNPDSPEEVLNHLETLFKKCKFIDKHDVSMYEYEKQSYTSNTGEPTSPLEWSDCIAHCFCLQEVYIFKNVLGIVDYTDKFDNFRKAIRTAVTK